MGLGADVRVVLVDVFALLDGALVRAELHGSVPDGGRGRGLVTKKVANWWPVRAGSASVGANAHIGIDSHPQ